MAYLAAWLAAWVVLAPPALAQVVEAEAKIEVVATTRDCAACPAMVEIPAGAYWMGSTPAALDRPFLVPERVRIEQPRQRVSIAYGFAMGRTEVTVREYRAFIEATGHESAECQVYDFDAAAWVGTGRRWSDPGFVQGDAYPAVCVSWHDATAYTHWLSEATGRTYRLPSEAEWEYAARAGTETLWPWGEEKDVACRYANSADHSGLEAGVASAQAGVFDCDDGHAHTAPADFGLPNGFGLHGMIGNAGEWQADCLVRTLEGHPTDGSARIEADCGERTIRGGSWFNPPMYNRPAFRYGTSPGAAFTLVGFRVVRENAGAP